LLDLWESKSDKEISDRYCVLSDGGSYSYQSVNPSHMGGFVVSLVSKPLVVPEGLNFIGRAAVAIPEAVCRLSCRAYFICRVAVIKHREVRNALRASKIFLLRFLASQ
jgi:hypothetical protein